MSPRDSEARELATLAMTGAAEAARDTAAIRGQAKAIGWMVALVGGVVVSMFGWLVVEVRSQGDRAAERAAVVAERTVLAADRRIDQRLSQVAQDAAREAIRLRDEQTDRLTARAP